MSVTSLAVKSYCAKQYALFTTEESTEDFFRESIIVGCPTVVAAIPDLKDLADEHSRVRNWAKNIAIFKKQGFGVHDDNPAHGEGLGRKLISLHPFGVILPHVNDSNQRVTWV